MQENSKTIKEGLMEKIEENSRTLKEMLEEKVNTVKEELIEISRKTKEELNHRVDEYDKYVNIFSYKRYKLPKVTRIRDGNVKPDHLEQCFLQTPGKSLRTKTERRKSQHAQFFNDNVYPNLRRGHRSEPPRNRQA
ncbi:hypothetical protein FQA39_LY14217 [Lamprigera yunnana]|nr:hypothetical protein FQA39_LY14217 [Lamprigera yunnana]